MNAAAILATLGKLPLELLVLVARAAKALVDGKPDEARRRIEEAIHRRAVLEALRRRAKK